MVRVSDEQNRNYSQSINRPKMFVEMICKKVEKKQRVGVNLSFRFEPLSANFYYEGRLAA